MRCSSVLRATAAAGVALVALPLVGVGQAGAQTDTGTPSDLGGWTVTADANALDILVDSPAGLAGEHPIDELDLPEAYTDFETGPFGTARASVLYPGSVVANFGTASGQLNLGIPSQLQPIVGQLNDPVLAVSSYPGGPASATYPTQDPADGEVAEMTSSANENGVAATSALQDTTLDGLLTVSGVKSTSSSDATNTAAATATTSVGDVSILGGLIQIQGMSSTTSATSDGTTATVTGRSTPATITLAGYQIGVDNNGINLGPVSSIPITGGLITSALNQLISTLGLSIQVLPQTQTVQGNNATIDSAGLQVSYTLPASLDVPNSVTSLLSQLPSQLAVIGTLPQVMQQGTFTFTIGRSTSTADASAPFNVNIPTNIASSPTPSSGASTSASGGSATTLASLPSTNDAGGSGVLADTGGGSSDASPGIAGTSSSDSSSPSPSTAASPPTSTAAHPGASQPIALAALPISLSSPVGAGVVGLLILSTVALAYGLRLLATRLAVQPAGPPCPLEEENL